VDGLKKPVPGPRSSTLGDALCASLGVRAPLTKEDVKETNRKEQIILHPGGSFSLHRTPHHLLVHPSGTSAVLIRPITLPTPNGSRNLTNRRDLGLDSKTRTPPGFFPSHASNLTARSFPSGSGVGRGSASS
jgi:hypothetical protein